MWVYFHRGQFSEVAIFCGEIFWGAIFQGAIFWGEAIFTEPK